MLGQLLSKTTFAVVDVETTGLDARVDRVVEVACIRVRAGNVIRRFASLVDSERSIPSRASDVHGIVDADVAGAPTLARLAPRIVALTRGSVVVAHSARFDAGFLPMIGRQPLLCTLKLARRLVDAPSYRNDALRAFLRLRPARRLGGAHRAASDAEVTVALLLELVRRFERTRPAATVGALLATLERPAPLERFAFGRHRGQDVSAVPTSYLRWIVAADFENWPDVAHTARRELGRRGYAP